MPWGLLPSTLPQHPTLSRRATATVSSIVGVSRQNRPYFRHTFSTLRAQSALADNLWAVKYRGALRVRYRTA